MELTIKKPGTIFKLAEHALLRRLEGFDDKGKKRCVFNLAQRVVITQGPRGGNKRHIRMMEFVTAKHLLEQAWLVTLTWRAPGGFEGSPLELLALCGEDE
jgi:hypothetical protein